MTCFIGFLPTLLFVLLYGGGGLYFTYLGIDNAFYQLPPTVAIIPALSLGWFLYHGTTQERMQAFLNGARHRDIMTMCVVFLLAGAFSVVSKSIGSVDATVNLTLSFVSPQFLLVGIFFTSAFIATAIGTSMGTIATIAPLAVGLIDQGAFSAAVGMATVVGGAMFGDNLSIISDTTIAAVMSQEANIKEKLRLNCKVALVASIITVLILIFTQEANSSITPQAYSLILVTPYLLLILLAILGVNVFIVLAVSLVFAGVVGALNTMYTVMTLSHDIAKGFASMQEIMLLSLMVGGLSGLAGQNSQELATQLSEWVSGQKSQKMAQLLIAKIVSIYDILLANNTIAIIFSGEISRKIAKRHHIPAHYSAAWLDIFSCVFQGIIPHGAQILLASAIAGISPLSVIGHVYYCYALGIVSVLYILCHKIKRE